MPVPPSWSCAQKKLDEAVFAAYGWPSDLSDEEILERLLTLKLERAREGLNIRKKQLILNHEDCIVKKTQLM
jgi:hypothetical protein